MSPDPGPVNNNKLRWNISKWSLFLKGFILKLRPHLLSDRHRLLRLHSCHKLHDPGLFGGKLSLEVVHLPGEQLGIGPLLQLVLPHTIDLTLDNQVWLVWIDFLAYVQQCLIPCVLFTQVLGAISVEILYSTEDFCWKTKMIKSLQRVITFTFTLDKCNFYTYFDELLRPKMVELVDRGRGGPPGPEKVMT